METFILLSSIHSVCILNAAALFMRLKQSSYGKCFARKRGAARTRGVLKSSCERHPQASSIAFPISFRLYLFSNVTRSLAL